MGGTRVLVCLEYNTDDNYKIRWTQLITNIVERPFTNNNNTEARNGNRSTMFIRVNVSLVGLSTRYKKIRRTRRS